MHCRICRRSIAQPALLHLTLSLAAPTEQNRSISTALDGVGGGRQSTRRGEMNRHARGQATSLSVAWRRNVLLADDDVRSFVPAAADDLLLASWVWLEIGQYGWHAIVQCRISSSIYSRRRESREYSNHPRLYNSKNELIQSLQTWYIGIYKGYGFGIERSKVKGQSHRVTNCRNILKAIEWPVWTKVKVSHEDCKSLSLHIWSTVSLWDGATLVMSNLRYI